MKDRLWTYWARLGVYRTLPVFFLLGASIEWFMINVRVGKETFCTFITVYDNFIIILTHTSSVYYALCIIDDTIIRKEVERRAKNQIQN